MPILNLSSINEFTNLTPQDATTDDVDSVGMDGSIKYFNDLKVKLDEVTVLAILTLLEAPTLGELTRDGFVSGWKKLNVDTIPHQQSYALLCRETLPTDKELFTRVYNHTFSLALTQGQKAVQLETATEYWRLLLTAPSLNWSTPKTPWLTWWIEYLGTQWKKSVNKDLWKQTGKFVAESLKDETMGFWSEDGAWPSVIDDFVAFVKEKRAEGGQAMDTQ